jgi:hypothetical protein
MANAAVARQDSIEPHNVQSISKFNAPLERMSRRGNNRTKKISP